MNSATHLESNLESRLERLAYRRSKPFCYSCYMVVPQSGCPRCGSDDNMRVVENVACEYGIGWVVRHIIETELTPVDTKAAFKECIAECYSETTKVGWIEFDTITVLETLDPISWEMAESEYIDQQVDDGELVTFDGGSTYYRSYDIEAYLNKADEEQKESA